MDQCPKCSSSDVHRSRAKSKWETWRKEITGKRPFRCSACGWRGWAADPGPKFSDAERALAERAVAPDPPNLHGTMLARDEPRPKDVSLADLDVLAPIAKPADSRAPDSE